MATATKQEPEVIGKIGSNNVAMINGFPCIQLGRRYIGVTKIKMVLANIEACRQFLIQYDKPKAPEPAPATAGQADRIAELEAMVRRLSASAAAQPAAPAPAAPAAPSSGRFSAA